MAPGVHYTDWKIALGELGLNLRREMSDKPGREEMINMIAAELEPIDHKLQTNVTAVSTKAAVEDISALDNALTDLRTKVAGELTGGRYGINSLFPSFYHCSQPLTLAHNMSTYYTVSRSS